MADVTPRRIEPYESAGIGKQLLGQPPKKVGIFLDIGLNPW